ncbi:uncharacterized protein EI97DRAFT_463387 [Westerdykella ornata]|uniref:DUF6604 domain-containing protein n=1 Tax=Westerdykella ornata TaxID=318751 RepID=A0A6A6JWH7_WESOR|nr:uncharacterized protein EI97DRAFT_463387 [Westerdykella ornata]KAF2280970.1 hypothetical protein EI97DRAFT_463387 [Westerdykella ornata]
MDYYKLQELPQTYKQCKKHTEKFEQWFIETARKREIELANYHVDTSKSHSKKGRKKRHKVPVAAYVPIAQEIVKSGVPLDDTSGINDLSDAIRTRKEVTAWHRIHNLSDDGHPFFIGILTQAKDILSGGKSSKANTPGLSTSNCKVHDLQDRVPFFFTINVLDALNTEEDKPQCSTEFDVPDASAPFGKTTHKRKTHPSKGLSERALTRDEMELEQEFQMLCFLYDYNQIKEFVRQVWLTYREKGLGLVTAALITDLALAIIRRNVAALIQDMEDYPTGRSFVEVLKDLYEKLLASERDTLSNEDPGKREATEDMRRRIGNRLCIPSLLHLEQHYQGVAHKSEPTQEFLRREPFLAFFSSILKKNLHPPVLDNYTQGMLSSPDRPQPWLVFGLQLVTEVQAIVQDIPIQLFKDLADSIHYSVTLMQAHIQYEDRMWEAGTRPDYMCFGEIKFSNLFLEPCQDMLAWLRRVLEDDKRLSGDKKREENSGPDSKSFSAVDFMSFHPTLSGLAVYHISRNYQINSIAMTQWFMVAICHLYNACRQIGGLNITWPDLEYIIEMQGVKGIFVGDPPTDPQFFWERLQYAMTFSAQSTRPEHLQRHPNWTKWARANMDTKKKRGLQCLTPLHVKLRDYYYGYRPDERWMKLQNLFAYLYHSETPHTKASFSGIVEDLQPLFSSMAEALSPPRLKRRKNVKIPKFSSQTYVYADILSEMQTQLQATEMHGNFDYLSFYRRTYTLVLQIRKVLFDEQKELENLRTQDGNPSNLCLLSRLFYDLKIQTKGKDIHVQGNELSKDAVALDQLQAISKMLEDFIRKEGRAELDNAERLSGMSSDLNAPNPKSESVLRTDAPFMPEPPPCPEPPVRFGSPVFPGPPPSNGTPTIPRSPSPVSAVSAHHVLIDGRPGKLFHRFTYSSTASRKERLVLSMGRSSGQLQLAGRKKRTNFFRALGIFPRLVGRRKHRIMFRCLGVCCLGKAARGKPMDVVAFWDRWVRAMGTVGFEWEREDGDDVGSAEGWETSSELSDDFELDSGRATAWGDGCPCYEAGKGLSGHWCGCYSD